MNGLDDMLQIFPILDRVIQWVILPILAIIYSHNKQHNEHEKKFIKLEGDNARILSILEERQKQQEDNRVVDRANAKTLAEAINRLNSRLDHEYEALR